MVNGIIYKIVCNETNEVYYGSTQHSLNMRMRGHKSGYNSWKQGNNPFTTSFQIIERGNYSYSLIETVECEDRHQLEAVERKYIENNECINKCIPCRSQEEYDKSISCELCGRTTSMYQLEKHQQREICKRNQERRLKLIEFNSKNSLKNKQIN
jgi:hypothetical protein